MKNFCCLVVLVFLFTVPVFVSAEDSPSDSGLQQEWLSVQIDLDGQERSNWWRHVSVAELDEFLAAGVDINIKNGSGDTPLHWAAATSPNVAVVTRLIDAGADVNAKDKFGWLPIHTAAERNENPQIIATLLDAGSKKNKRAYYVLFSPKFLLKHNDNMTEPDKAVALALLEEAK